MHRTALSLILPAISLLTPAAPADDARDWPQWRGPHLNGVSDARDVALEWSETRNIRWKSALPSWSGATPIVWGERVFVTSPSDPRQGPEADVARRLPRSGARSSPGGRELLLICYSRADGTELWRRTLDDRNQQFGKQNLSSPSPVTDGRHVWALTGTGVLRAFDFDGKEKWRRDLAADYGEFSLLWGYGSSPLLHDGMVIVPMMHTGEKSRSYLAAFDGGSGRTIWKVDRVTDARNECPDAYTTPTLMRRAAAALVIVSGADWVTAHDPANGVELWRSSGLNPERRGNYRVVASPVVAGDLVFAPTRVRPLIAVRGDGHGDVSATHLAWRYEDAGGPDVPTPACDGTRLFLVDDKGLVVCLDAASGRRLWGPERTAVGTVSASPVIAEGRLYVTNETATTTVLSAGSEFRILATNQLDDEYTLASMAVCGREIFVRTSSHLYCIAPPGGDARRENQK